MLSRYVAAAVVAEVEGAACSRCQFSPWRPTSRTHVDVFVRNGEITECMACSQSYQAYLDEDASDEVIAARAEKAHFQAWREARDREAAEWMAFRRARWEEEQRERRAEDDARARVANEWERRCRELFLERAAPFNPRPEWERVAASVEVEVAVLAALRYAPSASPVPPLLNWGFPALRQTPLAPSVDYVLGLLEDWKDARLLAIDPDSDRAAFTVAPSLDEVRARLPQPSSWIDVEAALPAPTSVFVGLAHVSWFSPHGLNKDDGANNLDTHLAARLTLDAMTDRERREQLLDLVTRLMTQEIARYFDFRLADLGLPAVARNHRPRLLDAALRLAAHRSLGEAFYLAYKFTKRAAEHPNAQRSDIPKANMTTFAVNRFESEVFRVASDPTQPLYSYREDTRIPLSAMTQTVFHHVLQADRMTCRPVELLRASWK